MFKKKLFTFLFSLFVVVTATFFLMHAVPGDPFSDEKALPEEILKAMQAHYGLDKPIIFQYFSYLKGLLSFDLGPSLKYPGRQVSEIILEGFPISFCLGLEALFLALFFGLLGGAFSALHKGKWQDSLVLLLSTFSLAIPSFLLATFLQYLLAMKLSFFPVARWGTVSHSILPALALSALPMAFITRLLRANIIEILSLDFIQTAKSKGLSPSKILFFHTLRNALLPLLAYLGPLTASVLTGGFAVEKIFGIPGLGQWFVLSILNRDYTMIMGTTIFYSAILMACVLILDLISSFVDPRTKNHSSSNLFYE